MGFPLASSTWNEEEVIAIQKIIDSGMYTMGENVAAFEDAFAKYIGKKYCVMVNSGSSANLLAIAALFYRENNALCKGDEIIVPAVSWSTTYYPLYQYGLKLKFVDIDPLTFNYDLKALKEAISEKTRAMMIVNLLGNPNDFDEIKRIVDDKKIYLIEDNCEALGASYNDKMAGTFGIVGTFSTFFSHHITTMEGGLIITDDEELYHILLCLRAHGWTRQLPKYNKVFGLKSEDEFVESFRFLLPGYNVRPLEISGAVGLTQLKKLPEFISTRRENAKVYKDLFHDHKIYSIQNEIGCSSWFGFAFVIKKDIPVNRKAVIEKLISNNIDCRPVVAGNFTKNPVMKWLDYEIYDKLSNADLIDQNGFFVGNHHYNIRDNLIQLKSILDSFSY